MRDINSDFKGVEDSFRTKYAKGDLSFIDEVFYEKNSEKDFEQLLRNRWDELVQKENSDEKNLDHILWRIHYEINTKAGFLRKESNFIKLLKWISRIAAILILPLAVYSGIHFFNTSKNDGLTWVEIKAPAWTRAQFELPDGTTGWLNSNSSIKYDGRYPNNRQITLCGEAFFDVPGNKKKPFEVVTNEIVVSVLGTRFNIASYENENIVEIVLEEGEIVCYNKVLNESYSMKPKDYISFDKTLNVCKFEVVQPEKYSSWKEGKLVFRNDPIDILSKRLERWYNIEVEIRGNKTSQTRLWATFVDENLEEVLKLLKLSLHIDYEIKRPQLQADGIYSKTKVIVTSNTN